MCTSLGYLYAPTRDFANSTQLLLPHLGAGLEGDKRPDLLPQTHIGPADHSRHRHVRVLEQGILNVAREYVEPAADDQPVLH
jgi:hypothetical protein